MPNSAPCPDATRTSSAVSGLGWSAVFNDGGEYLRDSAAFLSASVAAGFVFRGRRCELYGGQRASGPAVGSRQGQACADHWVQQIDGARFLRCMASPFRNASCAAAASVRANIAAFPDWSVLCQEVVAVGGQPAGVRHTRAAAGRIGLSSASREAKAAWHRWYAGL